MNDAGRTSLGMPAKRAGSDRFRAWLGGTPAVSMLAAATALVLARLATAGSGIFVPTGRMHVAGATYGSGNIDVPLGAGACWAIAIAAASVVAMPLWPRNLPRVTARLLLAPSRRAFVTLTFLAVLAAGSAASWLVFGNQPRDVDHTARAFQARTLASGSLSVATAPVPEAFDAYGLVRRGGRTFAKYEPGGAILLAAWYRATGFLWGLQPILGALVPLLLYGAFRRWHDELTARTAAALACLSPFFVFMAASFHSHVSCLFFLSVFLYAFARGWPAGSRLAAFAAGVGLGLAFATRPYSAMLFGWPFALYVLVTCRTRVDVVRLLVLGLGFALPVAALLGYNAEVTGDALLFPFHLADPDQVPWFGHKGHTFGHGLANTLGMLKLLGLATFGSPAGLAFAAGALALAKNRWDWLLITSAASLVVGYTTYYWTDYSNGPRYYFEAMPIVLLLTARGLVHVRDVASRLASRRLAPDACWRFAAGLAAGSLAFAVTLYLPALIAVYANDYNGNYDLDLERASARAGLSHALVFVAPLPGQNGGYESAVLVNPLDLQAVSRLDHARESLRRRDGAEPSVDEIAAATGLEAKAVAEILHHANVVYARQLEPAVARRVIDAFPGRVAYDFRYDPTTASATFEPHRRRVAASSP